MSLKSHKSNAFLMLLAVVCVLIAVLPAAASLILDPYDPQGAENGYSGIKLRNTNVRWPDEPNYHSYPGTAENGSVFGKSIHDSGLSVVSVNIAGNTDFTASKPLPETVGDGNGNVIELSKDIYLMRDDISADVDLYFDMITSGTFSLTYNGNEAINNLESKKVTITLSMASFDERINSSRQLMVFVPVFFVNAYKTLGNHYYVPASVTSVDVKSKTITATFANLTQALLYGFSPISSLSPRETVFICVMLGYVQSGTNDLLPDPIIHTSSSDVPGADDTVGSVVTTLPVSAEHTELLVKTNGFYVLDSEKALAAHPEFMNGSTIPIPVFSADVSSSGNIAVVTQSITLNLLNNNTFADISVLKAGNDGTIGKFSWAENPVSVKDGEYYISEKRTGTIVNKSEKPLPGRQYVLYMGIKDNGSYDLDPAPGVVLDPAIIAGTVAGNGVVISNDSSSGNNGGGNSSGNSSNEGGGGGGCNAGAAALMLLLTVPFFIKRHK